MGLIEFALLQGRDALQSPLLGDQRVLLPTLPPDPPADRRDDERGEQHEDHPQGDPTSGPGARSGDRRGDRIEVDAGPGRPPRGLTTSVGRGTIATPRLKFGRP